MAATFNLAEYELSHLDLPATAWRVTYPDSQTNLDPITGDLVAADTERDIWSVSGLIRAASNHFNKGSTMASCFVSVFVDEQGAKAWAKQRGHPEEVFITEIDLRAVPENAYVFDAPWLAQALHTFWRPLENELIFLHRVPRSCLGKRRSLKQIYEDETLPTPCTPRLLQLISFHAPAELDETTNPATERTNPTTRYFKSAMEFSNRVIKKRHLLRVPHVQIAFHEDWKGAYGQEYVYAALPSELREKVLEACLQQHPTDPDDKELSSAATDWWKRIYIRNCTFTDARSGNASAESPASFDLCSTFAETRMGVTATLQLGISLKAKMENGSEDQFAALPDSTPWRVEIEAYDSCVTQTDVDVGPVPFSSRGRMGALPSQPCDVANDEVLRRLRELGL